MKKNKTIAYLMAATLLVGGTFLGTKALFTDQDDMVGEISISTGDLDIEVTNKGEWELHTNGEDDNKFGTGEALGKVKFDNLKHGDYIEKTVTITNQGTLKAIVDLQENEEVEAKLPDGMEYTATITQDGQRSNTIENIEMASGESIKVNLKLTVTGSGLHSKDNETINSDVLEGKIINLQNTYIVKAEQTANPQ